jgi:hypothetical protein
MGSIPTMGSTLSIASSRQCHSKSTNEQARRRLPLRPERVIEGAVSRGVSSRLFSSLILTWAKHQTNRKQICVMFVTSMVGLLESFRLPVSEANISRGSTAGLMSAQRGFVLCPACINIAKCIALAYTYYRIL